MNTDKVKFKLELKEENIRFSFVLIVIFIGLIISSVVFLFVDFSDSSIEAQGIASQWGEAVMQNNESMKYLLLSDSEKV